MFPIPTLPQLINRAHADLDARVPGASARLANSNLNILGIVHAGAIDGVYRYLSWIQKQMFVTTCDEEQLTIRATELTVPRKPASQASGIVIFQALPGSVIPTNADFVRSDGLRYKSVADGVESAGEIHVTIKAEDAGSAGNAVALTPISLMSPVAGVQSGGVVDASAIGGGSEIESIESWRKRLLQRMSKMQRVGTADDYEAWALEVPGVTRAWVYPQEMGAGTVTVRFVRDDDIYIIPDAGEVQDVQDYIDARRPIAAKGLYVVAPTALPIDFDIQIDPPTVEVKSAITAALTDLIKREAVPGGVLLLSHINEAISTAFGEHDHTLVTPAANVMPSAGELPVMGIISWV